MSGKSWLTGIATASPVPGDTSQNGECAPLFFILRALGLLDAPSMLVVDFGAGNGREMSNSRPLLDHGWSGRLYDVDPRGATDVIRARIDMHTASLYAVGCNVLLIDIDGMDFWAMGGALRTSSPALIVCEINTRFDREASFAIKYDPTYVWDGRDGYGMSLEAAIRLGAMYGYVPVHLHHNQNLFLLRKDYVPEGAVLPELAYTKDDVTHPNDPNATWIPIAAQ